MCQGLGRRLRSGGQLRDLHDQSGSLFLSAAAGLSQVWLRYDARRTRLRREPIVWRILLDDASLEIENYYLPISAYESAFRDAGFRDFAVHGLELAPDAEAGDDRAFWADMLNYPPAIMIECVKQ